MQACKEEIKDKTDNKPKQQKTTVVKKKKEKSKFELDNYSDSISYSLGINIGKNIADKGVNNIDVKAFTNGVIDVLEEKEFIISPDIANRIMLKYFEKQYLKKIALNIKEGEEFLATNKSKEGIKTLSNGLQYKILKEGSGAPPKLNDRITLHYQGMFLNGNVFESTVQKRNPVTISLDRNETIKGWTEALKLMKPGAKWRLFIPPDLAFGESGYKTIVEPYKTLIFDLEVMYIKKY
jgi:FKBP-type peptidyl-prolyl cis-trans isomerase FklB